MNYGFASAPNAPPPYQESAPPYQERAAVIKHPTSGLVLDATQFEVKLQHYTGYPAQLWVLEPLGNGRVFIRNRATGAVLDIEGGPDCGANIITYEKHGGVNQQWVINADYTIVSAEGNLAVDIYEGNYFPGSNLVAYDRHGGSNQQFYVQYQ